MSSPPRVLPEFFKVFLPEYSWDRLRIPTAFIEHFNGHVPEKAILREFNGRVWHVDVGQIQKDVYFMNGWQRFLTDNSVEEGDFLVFQYDGNHIFDFKLFGRTACEKKDTDKANVDVYHKDFWVKEEKDVKEAEREEEKQDEEEDEEEEEDAEEEEDDDEEEEEEEEEEDEEEEEEEDEEEEEEEEEDSTEEEEEEESSDEKEEDKTNDEEEEELEPEPESSNKKVVISKQKYSGRGRPPIGRRNDRGYKRTAVKNTRVACIGTSHSKSKHKNPSCTHAEVDNSFAMASIVEIKNPYFKTKLRPEPEPKSSNKKVVALKQTYSGRGRPPISSRNDRGYRRTAIKNFRVAYIGTSHSKSKYKKPSCTQAEVDNSFAMASIVESKNPYFKTKLRPMRPSKLYVPVDVLKDHNVALPPRVLLRDPLGRSWPGNVAVWKDGRTWVSGWRAFCKWNHLDENDTCICELVQERGRRRDVIVVHILRHNLGLRHSIANQS